MSGLQKLDRKSAGAPIVSWEWGGAQGEPVPIIAAGMASILHFRYSALMRQWVPLILIGCALMTALFALFGDDSFSHLQAMRQSLTQQVQRNADLRDEVGALRREVLGLQSDPRALEKAARNELGMARPNEKIFIFEERQSP